TFDPAEQRTVGKRDDVELLPASEFLLPAGGATELRARLKGTGAIGERLAADLDRFAAGPGAGAATASAGATSAIASGGATRAIDVGDAAEVWAAVLAPATGLDHLGPETILVLDEPGDIAESAAFLWRQAD